MDFCAGYSEIHQKIFVRPMVPVRRLARRQWQQAFNALHIKVQQKTTVEKQMLPPATLSVAGKFQVAQRQIAVALDANRSDSIAHHRCKKLPVFFHDEFVGRADVGEGTGLRYPQNQRVIQATRSLQNRTATGATPQDRDAVVPGLIEIGLVRILLE